MAKKYITVNGVLQKNPDYVDPSQPTQAKAALAYAIPNNSSNAPLAVVSTMDDLMQASAVQQNANGIPAPMSQSTDATVDMIQDDEILSKFNSPLPLDGGEILDKLTAIFAQYEIPLGMINKLMMLVNEEFSLDFIIDDSSSMGAPTDVDIIEATDPLKSAIREKLRRDPVVGEKMTRIQEAENRLHIMIGILAYIPVAKMQIRFLNDSRVMLLDRTGLSPDEFKAQAHREIRDLFQHLSLTPRTPLYGPLAAGFKLPGRWCHYLFNDGEPNVAGHTSTFDCVQEVVDLVKSQGKNLLNHPLTLISCTDNDADTAWMKRLDDLPCVAELDDYDDEKVEVLAKQGSAFPFTKGLWILAHLVAAICPDDLDNMDECIPFTRFTLSNILGRKLNPDEYQHYFVNNPNSDLYVQDYARFLNEESKCAREIIPTPERKRRENTAGYVDGDRPKHRPTPNVLAQIAPITAAARAQFSADHPVASTVSVATVTTQMSAASIAPRDAMFPGIPAIPAPQTGTQPSSVFGFGNGHS